MNWVYSPSTWKVAILVAASGLIACELTDVEDEELLDTQLRSQEQAPLALEAEATPHDHTDDRDHEGLAAPTFPQVEITAIGSEATLRWDPRPNTTYSVFRSTNPNFTATDPDATVIATGLTEGAYVDDFPLVLYPSDPYDLGAFYQVLEEDEIGRETPSAVVGRIPIPVRLSDPERYPSLDFSKIPLCLDPTPADAHQRMLIREDPLSMHWWELARWSFAADAAPFDAVLELDVGQFFAVRTRPDPKPGITHYQLTGRVPTEYRLPSRMPGGINAVIWPVTAEPTTASELLAAIPHALAVARWPVLQVGYGVDWYPTLPWGHALPGVTNHVTKDDFEIQPCTALYLYMDWPLGVILPPAEPK